MDITKEIFTAGGNKYYVTKSLSVERYKAYLKMQLQVGYDVGFSGVIESLQKIYRLCNEQKFADIAVLCHNMLKSIEDMDKREHPILILCALFINRDGEDTAIVDDALIQAKIDDWKEANIPMDFFLGYAKVLVTDYQRVYEEMSESSLAKLLSLDL